MDNAKAWRDFFQNWPKDMAPRGLIVTSFDEQIQFVRFLMTESMLLIERSTPDALGGRQVVIPFANIAALKVIDPVRIEIFGSAGFKEPATKS